jgi:hypothetical protein
MELKRALISGTLLVILAIVLLARFAPLFAQEPPSVSSVEAVITGPDDVAVGRTLVLDASGSRGIGEETQYRWYVEGVSFPVSRTVEMVYTPERAGSVAIRLEITTEIDGEALTAEAERLITVYERKIVLLADTSVSPEKIAVHQRTAEEANVYLRVIRPDMQTLPVSAEDAMVAAITNESAAFTGANGVLIWTEGILGLQALMRARETDPEAITTENQTVVVVTDRSLDTAARTMRGPFSVLHPERIVVTRKEAINPLISAADSDAFIVDLEQRDIDFSIVDEQSVAVRPWNLLSSLVNYMLSHGVSSQILILLLTLPIIATIIAFLKQVIGITTFGLYTPSIVALSFLALGWRVGLVFLLFILITGYGTRTLLRRWRILYVPKVAIILTVVSFTLLLLLGLSATFDITFTRDTIFVLLIMSTLAESFLNVQREEGLRSAILGVGETILASLLCVFIVSWAALQSFVLAYPEVVLLTIVIDALLGRFTGLRLVEYFRFREVFKHLQEE